MEALRLALRSPAANIRLHASIALSRALYDFGEFGEALAVAEAALQIAPDHAQALRAKAYALAARDRFAEARAILHRLQEREPENHELRRRLQALEKLPERKPRSSSYDTRAGSPLLIGIGGGIGDILHATPMIRNLARRMGGPVAVLVMPDHAESEFLVRNPEFISRGFTISEEVLDRRYDTVFLTHGFGPLRFRFNAGRVLASTEWSDFRPGTVQETLFHLEAAKHLLGIGYDMADVDRYFVADLRYSPPSEPLIGIHAGSKAGRWLSKRWPHFEQLAARLQAQGLRVASFGTPDEYVPGTENRTGGSIEEMCRAMMACSHFVSNDSGPMHIANALGMPVLAIFAPTDPFTHLPLGTSTEALALAKYCAPCEIKNHRHFAAGACRCIGEVSLEEAERRLLAILKGDTSDGEARWPAAAERQS
ncbi:MAG: glycosyltransferase family 9 protein [Alphaproteobacteria bacterium]|nr:glycosyltransferase family 9 protein [Alphaproteobacteria bacterium]